MSAVRSGANTVSIEDVKEARLERGGDISVIKKGTTPQVCEVKVEKDVQIVRIILN
jgi:uncharacterized membrane protein YcaP (DUF421 family)